MPLIGASISCWKYAQPSSGEGTCSNVPGMGAPSPSSLYRPDGRKIAAIHTSTVTMTSVVTADGNASFFLVPVVLMGERYRQRVPRR